MIMQDSTSRWSSGSAWGWEGCIAVWPPHDGAAWSLPYCQ